MAIISCPECRRKISNKAPICPHCGISMGEGDISQEQLETFRLRNLRDRIYHFNMISYAAMTVFLAGFGWYWWETDSFQQQSSSRPFILMGLSAVAYLVIRVLLFRARQQKKAIRSKGLLSQNLNRK